MTRTGDVIRQGQIRWSERPDDKRRPVLIVSRDGSIGSMSDVLRIPLTTRVRGLPTEILLGREDGLDRDSAANAQQIGEIPRTYLSDQIGEIAPGRWHEVCNAVAIAIGC